MQMAHQCIERDLLEEQELHPNSILINKSTSTWQESLPASILSIPLFDGDSGKAMISQKRLTFHCVSWEKSLKKLWSEEHTGRGRDRGYNSVQETKRREACYTPMQTSKYNESCFKAKEVLLGKQIYSVTASMNQIILRNHSLDSSQL